MSRPHPSALFLLLLVVVSLVLPLNALADEPVADGDGRTPVAPNTLPLPPACLGGAAGGKALIAVQRDSSGPAFAGGTTVTLTLETIPTSVMAWLTATTIALPADWATLPDGALSAAVTVQVMASVGSVPGSYEGTITYRAEGVDSSGASVTRQGQLPITWTAQDCSPVDTTPPTAHPLVSGARGNDEWFTSDVTVDWRWTDTGGSGIDPAQCQDTTVSTGEGEAVTISGTCRDAAGNSRTATVTAKIDKTPPMITVTSPVAGDYLLNEAVTADYACVDAVSGVATCSGALPAGAALDTSAAGVGAFAVSATDAAGNSASANVSYTVSYQVRPLWDNTKPPKAGSAVQLRLQLLDANGVSQAAPGIAVVARRLVRTDGPAPVAVSIEAPMRFDNKLNGLPGGGYGLSFDTKGLSAGPWSLELAVDGFTSARYLLPLALR